MNQSNLYKMMTKQKLLPAIKQFTLVLMIALVSLGGATGCKSKKKLAQEQAAAEYSSKVEMAKKDLNSMLDGTDSWSLAEKEQRFKTIKSWNLEDTEVQALLDKVEDKLARERADAERKTEEERLRKEEESRLKTEANKYDPLENYFRAIAASPDQETANEKIAGAMQLFATPDVPVLIIISQAGGFNDYDRPTTISKYLDYLKDQKVYNNRIQQVKYDANKRITELELIKK